MLRDAAQRGLRVRPRGGGTKLGWGRPAPADVELRTGGLDAVVAHDAGDLTAVLGAGTSLPAAQAAFARAGQRLALDPPDPGGATVGSGRGFLLPRGQIIGRRSFESPR